MTVVYVLRDNGLSAGTLPAGWGTQGAFEKLQELHLGSNSLSGSLPTQWGAARNGIVFPSLLTVDLSNNSFSGYLPSGWGTGFQVGYSSHS